MKRAFSVEATLIPYLWQTMATTRVDTAVALAERVCRAHSSTEVWDLLGLSTGPEQV